MQLLSWATLRVEQTPTLGLRNGITVLAISIEKQSPESLPHIAIVQKSRFAHVLLERRNDHSRKRRGTVLAPLPRPHDELPRLEVEVFDSQAQSLQKTHAPCYATALDPALGSYRQRQYTNDCFAPDGVLCSSRT